MLETKKIILVLHNQWNFLVQINQLIDQSFYTAENREKAARVLFCRSLGWFLKANTVIVSTRQLF